MSTSTLTKQDNRVSSLVLSHGHLLPMKLRDTLLSSLKDLPGKRSFHLHVLVSSARKNISLFPYASTKHRIYEQEIIVLLSEQKDSSQPQVMVSAIAASLYQIPSTRSAILYISKVDSTGQGIRPSPTPALVRSFIEYYADPVTRPIAATHLWVHLFARAQSQYLFPNSADYSGKRPLSDVKLCAWWKRVYTAVATNVASKRSLKAHPRLFYVLPGMNELDALQALGEFSAISMAKSTSNVSWTYGHPYSLTDTPLPYAGTKEDSEIRHNLGQYIPCFDDDPKARFMDEMACTRQVDGIHSPPRKRRKMSDQHGGSNDDEKGDRRKVSKGKEKEVRIEGELGDVSTEDFWERMGFRQECVAGAVTGFFVAVFSSDSKDEKGGYENTVPKPQSWEVSHHIVNRVVQSLMAGCEFSTSERAVRATEILEGAIRGLCGGTSSRVPGLDPAKHDDGGAGSLSPSQQVAPSRPQTPPPQRHRGTTRESVGDVDEVADGEVLSEDSPSGGVSADIYDGYVYGTITIENEPSAKGNGAGSIIGSNEKISGPAVTVLAVRKRVKAKK